MPNKTVTEFAKEYGITRQRVLQLIQEKRVQAKKRYGIWLIPESEKYVRAKNEHKHV